MWQFRFSLNSALKYQVTFLVVCANSWTSSVSRQPHRAWHPIRLRPSLPSPGLTAGLSFLPTSPGSSQNFLLPYPIRSQLDRPEGHRRLQIWAPSFFFLFFIYLEAVAYTPSHMLLSIAYLCEPVQLFCLVHQFCQAFRRGFQHRQPVQHALLISLLILAS